MSSEGIIVATLAVVRAWIFFGAFPTLRMGIGALLALVATALVPRPTRPVMP